MRKRLQKILSEAGITSRRSAEGLIIAGKVQVNGITVTKLGTSADPERDKITIDGKALSPSRAKVYYLFHKPPHRIVSRHDPEGRPTIYEYLKAIPERVNPVGRLDFDSEGLLLLTNDGDLHAYLTHPRHEIPKVYHVKIKGHLTEPKQKRLEDGIDIGGYVTQPCLIKILKKNPENSWIAMTLREGKNRQIRRMMAALGPDHQVLRLVRVAIGPLQMADLQKGRCRSLTPKEVVGLQGLKGTSKNRPSALLPAIGHSLRRTSSTPHSGLGGRLASGQFLEVPGENRVFRGALKKKTPLSDGGSGGGSPPRSTS